MIWLAFAKIFKYRPNVLILDEPINHMDIVGKVIKNKSCQENNQILLKEQSRIKLKIEKLEREIEEDEEKIKELNEELITPEYSVDFIRLQALQDEIAILENQVHKRMEEWTMLQEVNPIE